MLKAKRQYDFSTHVHPVIDIDPAEDQTQQHFERETNINSIVNRYQKTGVLPTALIREVQFGEVGPDLVQSLNKIKAAKEQFMQMPAKIREEFRNDPDVFMRFLADPHNYSKAVELGIVEERKVEKTEKDYLKEIAERFKNGHDGNGSKSGAGSDKGDN
jgi:phage internal scaffolding protein